MRSESQSVNANVVFPSKVTVVPVLSLLRFSVVELGTAKFEITIDVQDAVAEETCAIAVTVHAVPLGALVVVVVVLDFVVVVVDFVVVVLDFVVVVLDFVVLVLDEVFDVVVAVVVGVVTADGTHCEKKGFWTTHADPTAHAVGPVQFSPPH